MKLSKFQKELVNKKIDLAIFCNYDYDRINPNLFYFTGYEGLGTLVVTPKDAFLIVPKMEFLKAKQYIKTYYNKEPFKFILSVLKKKRIGRVGIETTISLAMYKKLKKELKCKIAFISDICSRLRAVKTEKEIKNVKYACKLASKILEKCLNCFQDFNTEAEVKYFLECEARRYGCQEAFSTIVASGKNSCLPHHLTGKGNLNKGFCIIDFGIKFSGYCSDITRTVYVGKPKEKDIKIYNFLLSVQEKIIESITPNMKCSNLYLKTLRLLSKYKRYFNHGLGHGIGIDVHELPNLIKESKDKIKEGMVFTIEPGIYLPNKFGIRIEDDILISENVEVLTDVEKEFRNY